MIKSRLEAVGEAGRFNSRRKTRGPFLEDVPTFPVGHSVQVFLWDPVHSSLLQGDKDSFQQREVKWIATGRRERRLRNVDSPAVVKYPGTGGIAKKDEFTYLWASKALALNVD